MDSSPSVPKNEIKSHRSQDQQRKQSILSFKEPAGRTLWVLDQGVLDNLLEGI